MGTAQPLNSHDSLGDDLRLSHAFVGTLSAAYRGMWVFESVLDKLDPGMDREDELNKTERVLDTLEDWWKQLDDGLPLMHSDDRPLLSDDASKAWRLLQVAEGRLRALIGELTSTSDLELLLEDPLARHIRVAAMCEVAHSHRATLRSLLAQAESLGAKQEAEVWRSHLLSSEEMMRRAEDMFHRIQDAGADPSQRLVAELLDRSLLLPARVAQRVVDIGQVFSLYTGVFDYEDAGIPDAQTEIWSDAGFEPQDAGRWFAAGLSPRLAREWIEAGAADPLVAAGYLWRGFTADEAEPWLARFISGRNASSWRAAGSDAEDAREWITLGIRNPDDVAMMPATDRVM